MRPAAAPPSLTPAQPAPPPRAPRPWEAFESTLEEEEEVFPGERRRRAQQPPASFPAPPAHLAARPLLCARCHALQHYGRVPSAAAEALLPSLDFEKVVGAPLRRAAQRSRPPLVLLVVDLVDFDGSFPAAAAALLSSLGDSAQVVLAATKADLLPRSASPARLEQWVRARARAGGLTLHLAGVRLLGAPARYGVSSLAECCEELARSRTAGDLWVLGAQNAGKSTLIGALCAHYYGPAFRAAPVASHVAGTTLAPVRLPDLLPGKRSVVDTPGLLHAHQLSSRLTADEARLVLPRKPLKPRTFRVPQGACVSVGGLFRVDVLASPGATLYLTVWASADVSTHWGRAEGGEELRQRHLGGALRPPLLPAGEEEAEARAARLEALGRVVPRTVALEGSSWTASSVDLAVAGAGWVAVACLGQAQLRVWTHAGVAVTMRDALLPDLARELETPGFDFEKAGKARGGREAKAKARR